MNNKTKVALYESFPLFREEDTITFDLCYKAAKLSKGLLTFQREHPKEYEASIKNRWVHDFVWLKKPTGYWTLEMVNDYIDYHHITTIEDFGQNHSTVYAQAQIHGYLKHLKLKRNSVPDGYWDVKENVEKLSKNYEYLKDFTNDYPAAVQSARDHGWLKDFTWLKRINRPHGWYKDYDLCYEEAHKFETLTDFAKGSSRAYNYAKKMGWLESFGMKSKPRTGSIPGYWNNRERCKKKISEFSSWPEFRKFKGSVTIIKICKRNGWEDLFDCLGEDSYKAVYPNGYWYNFYHCNNAAKECRNRGDFCKTYAAAYNVSRIHNWLEIFYGDETLKYPDEFWEDYDNFQMIFKTLSDYEDFATKYPNGYYIALEKGWLSGNYLKENYDKYIGNEDIVFNILKTYDNFVEFKKDRPYLYANICSTKRNYLFEKAFKEILIQNIEEEYYSKYENCRDLVINSDCWKGLNFKKLYPIAFRNIRNRFPDLYKILHEYNLRYYTDKIDNVYKYEFPDVYPTPIYIGRTVHPKSRDMEHICSDKSAVSKYASENKLDIPQMEIIATKLTLLEGLKLEDELVKKYQNDKNYNVLNIAATGVVSGSLGTLNYESLNRVFKKASYCKSYSEFKEKFPKDFQRCCLNEQIYEFDWLEQDCSVYVEWTEELLQKTARECVTAEAFRIEYPEAYRSAKRTGLFDKLDLIKGIHFSPSEWNRIIYPEIYKKPTKTKKEPKEKKTKCDFINGKAQLYWTPERRREAALECKSRGEFQKKYKRAYNLALQTKQIDEFDWLTTQRYPEGYWTKERVIEEAAKYKTKGAFQNYSFSAYTAALKNGWLDELVFENSKIVINMTYEEAKEYAAQFKNKTNLKSNSTEKYTFIKNKGWLDEFFPENYPERIEWTDEMIIEEGSKYKNRKEFEKQNHTAYMKAKERNLLDNLFPKHGNLKHTFEEINTFCKENHITTRAELRKLNKSMHRTAEIQDWFGKLNLYVKENKLKYSKEKIEKVCDMFCSQEELNKHMSGAYKYGIENNLLDDLLPKTGEWTVERLLYLKQKYNFQYLMDLRKFSRMAFKAVIQLRAGKELNLLYSPEFTDNMFFEEAKKYKNRREIADKNIEYYNYGLIYDLFDEVYGKKTMVGANQKWTIEKIQQIIDDNLCSCQRDLERICSEAVQALRYHKWQDKLVYHTK